MSTDNDRNAGQDFEWQGRTWHLRTSYWKSQKRYHCLYCAFDHYLPKEALKHLALGHLHSTYRDGERFDLLVVYQKGTKIYKCFDCTFESKDAGVVAEHCSTNHRKPPLSAGERVMESIAAEPENAPPGLNLRSPPRLSDRDLLIHETVGERNFKNLTNVELMKTAKLRSQLRQQCSLKPGNPTRMAFDRIRRAKNYPLSRQITKKRSIQPPPMIDNDQSTANLPLFFNHLRG